jgi:hypothetical protein
LSQPGLATLERSASAQRSDWFSGSFVFFVAHHVSPPAPFYPSEFHRYVSRKFRWLGVSAPTRGVIENESGGERLNRVG